MATPEPRTQALVFVEYLCRSLDRIVGCLAGLDEVQARWCPPAPKSNSLLVLARHALSNAEENLLGILCGLPVARDADELRNDGLAAEVVERWANLRPRLLDVAAATPDKALDAPRDHPRRGKLTGRDVLIVAVRHAAEHMGQAELTRDLLMASLDSPSRSNQ